MDYKLVKWNQSNYEIKTIMTQEDQNSIKEKVLKWFQKEVEVKWFRKWHAPMNMVEKQIRPEYVQMWILEEAIHSTIQDIMKDNQDIKFIWDIYDLNQEAKDWNIEITFKLDVYPECNIKNENYKAIKAELIDNTVSDNEIETAITNMQRQYAEYYDYEKIENDTVFKVKFNFLDKKWEILDSWSAFLWKEDFEEHKILEEKFMWKILNEKISEKYEHDKLPHLLHYHKDDSKPAKIEYEIVEIKKSKLPELNEEFLVKYFWNEMNSVEKLKDKIKEVISKQKEENWLSNFVNEVIEKASSSIEVFIPKTLVHEEEKAKIQNLKERLWWEEGFNKYMNNISDEKKNEMMEELKKTSKESLEKFFILRQIIELYWIDDVNWNIPLDPERKLYEKITQNLVEKEKNKKTTSKNSKKSTE